MVEPDAEYRQVITPAEQLAVFVSCFAAFFRQSWNYFLVRGLFGVLDKIRGLIEAWDKVEHFLLLEVVEVEC